MTPEKLIEQVEFFASAKASYAVAHAANDPQAADNFASEAMTALLTVKAEVERLTARLTEARSQLEGWEQVGNNIAHHIPEHYEAGYNSHEDWARDAADVVAKAHAWRKNGRRTPGACRCHCQLALPAANPWDHAEICPAYVAREEIHLDAAVEKIYPTGVYL